MNHHYMSYYQRKKWKSSLSLKQAIREDKKNQEKQEKREIERRKSK